MQIREEKGVVRFPSPPGSVSASAQLGQCMDLHILYFYIVQSDVEFSSFHPSCFSPSLLGNKHLKFILFYHTNHLWEERRIFFASCQNSHFGRSAVE